MMKGFLYVVFLLMAAGCGLPGSDKEFTKGKSAQERGEPLLRTKPPHVGELPDSATIKISRDQLRGLWSVNMQCVETSCASSALGDSKNERWDFKMRGDSITVTATRDARVVRIYAGQYQENTLRLFAKELPAHTLFASMVRLQERKDKEMEGEREVVQSNGCHIVYALQLKKL